MNNFSACPTWWVRAGLLKSSFPGGEKTGESIAALKCVIAISHRINYYTMQAGISYSDIEEATGLSRPMVSRGITLLQRLGIVRITKKYRNIYELVKTIDDTGWAKLPKSFLRKELSQFPNRGRIILCALKLYIQFLTDRPNHSMSMRMTYDTIQEKVGIQPRDIKPSIDILFSHQLISVTRAGASIMDDAIVYKSNEYTIKGL